MRYPTLWRPLSSKRWIGVVCLAGAGCAGVGSGPAQPATAGGAGERLCRETTVTDAVVTNTPPAEGYAWNTLARIAAANCSEAKALLLDALAERHQTAVATGWRNPQLRVGRNWGDEDETTAGRTGTHIYPDEVGTPAHSFTRYQETEDRDFDGSAVGLRVYCANPFVNRWLRKRGAAKAQALEAEAKETSYAAFCEVRTLCLEADFLREEIGLMEQMAALREQLRNLCREQTDAGVAGPLDLARAETRLASLRSEIHEKRVSRQQYLRRIGVLTGLPPDQVKVCAGTPLKPVPTRFQDLAVLTDLAFMRRPDLARLEREKEAAQHEVKAARAGQIPWLEYVEGTFEDEEASTRTFDEYYSGYDYSSRDRTEWQVRVALTVPVFNWLGDEVRLSRAQLAAAEARVQGLYKTIRLEVGGVLEDYRSARTEYDRFAEESRKTCQTVTARIDALAKSAIKRDEVLAAREELLAYRRVCLRTERECRLTEQYLETVSGGSLMEEKP